MVIPRWYWGFVKEREKCCKPDQWWWWPFLPFFPMVLLISPEQIKQENCTCPQIEARGFFSMYITVRNTFLWHLIIASASRIEFQIVQTMGSKMSKRAKNCFFLYFPNSHRLMLFRELPSYVGYHLLFLSRHVCDLRTSIIEIPSEAVFEKNRLFATW